MFSTAILSRLLLVSTAMPLVTAAGALLVDSLNRLVERGQISLAIKGDLKHRSRQWLFRLTVLTALLSVMAWLVVAADADKLPLVSDWGVALYVDALSLVLGLPTAIVCLLAAWFVERYLDLSSEHSPQSPPAFYFVFNLFLFSVLVVPLLSNQLLIWAAITFATLVTMWLINFTKTPETFHVIKTYFLITGAGLVLALLGLVTLYEMTKQTLAADDTWPDMMVAAVSFSPTVAKLSFALVIIGYGAKAGFVPMHWWLAKAHSLSPFPVSALLSGILLKSALYAILRVDMIVGVTLGNREFQAAIWLIFGLASMLVAAPYMLHWRSETFKTLLAYSSQLHVGLIAVGLGLNNNAALTGAFLVLIAHALNKSIVFLVYGDINVQHTESNEMAIDTIKGLMANMPLRAALLAIGGLGLVGSPPQALALGEFLVIGGIVVALANNSVIWINMAVIVFIGVNVLIYLGVMVAIGNMILERPSTPRESVPWLRLAPLIVCTIVLVIMGLALPANSIFDLGKIINEATHLLQTGVNSAH